MCFALSSKNASEETSGAMERTCVLQCWPANRHALDFQPSHNGKTCVVNSSTRWVGNRLEALVFVSPWQSLGISCTWQAACPDSRNNEAQGNEISRCEGCICEVSVDCASP